MRQLVAEVIEGQQRLSDGLLQATLIIGDQIAKAAPLGQTVSVGGGSQPLIVVQKTDAAHLNSGGTTVGGFTFPALPEVLDGWGEGRRLNAGGCGIAFQETVWPKNPYGYAGKHGVVDEMPIPDLPQTFSPRKGVTMKASVTEDCCEVSGDVVVSMEIRDCGRTVKVQNLSEPIRIKVPLGTRPRVSNNVTETRICQFFNETSQSWAGDGCYVEELHDTHVVCGCNHLTTFAAGYGQFFTSFAEIIDCHNADLFSQEAMEFMQNSEWTWGRGGIVLWLLFGGFCWMATASSFQSGRTAKRYGFSREDILQSLSLDGSNAPVDHKALAMKRMLQAAQRYGRPTWLANLCWKLQCHLEIVVAPFEDSLMRSLPSALAVALVVKYVQTSSTENLGLRRCDVTKLVALQRSFSGGLSERGSGVTVAQRAQESLKALMQQYTDSFTKAQDELVDAAALQARSVRRIFKAYCPALQFLQSSVTTDWTVMALALCMSIFGTVATTALFFVGVDGASSIKSATECEGRTFVARFVRDVQVTLISALLTLVPTLTMKIMHERRYPQMQDESEVRDYSRRRKCEDGCMKFAGVCYIIACLLFTAAFLANVSHNDADHWVVSVILGLLMSWIGLPLVIALLWTLVMRRVQTDATLKSNVQDILEGMNSLSDRAPSKGKVYTYDDTGKPVLKPQWYDAVTGDPDTGESRRYFHKWAKRWARTARPPREMLALENGGSSAMPGARSTHDLPALPNVIDSPAGRSKVAITPATGFNTWAQEWERMQHRPERPVERSPKSNRLSVTRASVFSETTERSRPKSDHLDPRHKRLGLAPRKAKVLDLRTAAKPEEPETWVSSWTPPAQAATPPPPISAWNALDRKHPATPPARLVRTTEGGKTKLALQQ